jgi:CO/xanthine dehydrogenase Mo-binding subunit
VGHVVRRFEDDRLLRGQATYIEDMSRPGLAHIARVDYPRLRSQQAQRRARGELVGIGLASTVEVSGGVENGEVTAHADGSVTAITGTSPYGQGHVTSFAQLIADQLGVSPGQVTVGYGDTDSGPRGGGTMSSRGGTLGGNALQAAAATVLGKLMEAARHAWCGSRLSQMRGRAFRPGLLGADPVLHAGRS